MLCKHFQTTERENNQFPKKQLNSDHIVFASALIYFIYRVSKKKLMPFQVQISREFHYGTLSIPIGIQRTDRD